MLLAREDPLPLYLVLFLLQDNTFHIFKGLLALAYFLGNVCKKANIYSDFLGTIHQLYLVPKPKSPRPASSPVFKMYGSNLLFFVIP